MIAGSVAMVAYYTVCISYIRRAITWRCGALFFFRVAFRIAPMLKF